jgi:NADH-quinone oxidoreductase subunit A
LLPTPACPTLSRCDDKAVNGFETIPKKARMTPEITNYLMIAMVVTVAVGFAAVVSVLTHWIGPKRRGDWKESTYESGMQPYGDTRKTFHVRFYLVAVLFLVLDVELVFLYPMAVAYVNASAANADRSGPGLAASAIEAVQMGYTPLYVLGMLIVFFLLLGVGFLYEWRRGIFKWD